MFQRILVAIDEHEVIKDVFYQALTLAQMTGAVLNLIHVLTLQEDASPMMPIAAPDYCPAECDPELMLYQEEWKRYEHQGLELLRRHAREAIATGVWVEFNQVFGNPGSTICKVAHTWNADLIIMGRRKHSGLSELLMGSVSRYVFHHAPCSVLVVRSPSDL
jgi:nucleotide-binding universal stress UspA family protein